MRLLLIFLLILTFLLSNVTLAFAMYNDEVTVNENVAIEEPEASPPSDSDDLENLFVDNELIDKEQDLTDDFVNDVLTHTLGEPVGLQGFEGDYELELDEDTVEIIVQFVTPSSVALELMGDRNIASGRVFDAKSYEEQALSAHGLFLEQLADIAVVVDDFEDVIDVQHENIHEELDYDDADEVLFEAHGAPPEQQDANARRVEIFSEHHELFNGVYMRVPTDMVDSIASLPEVFAVFPNVLFRVSTPETADLINETLQTTSTAVDPNLLPEARSLLGIGNITQTGAGVRVAIIDTGVDPRHPAFANYLDNTGRLPGWTFWPGDGTYPIPITGHGTAVASSVIAMAPGVTLMSYRIQIGFTGGVSPGGTAIGAIEAARRDGANIINMSFGSPDVTSPFDPLVTASNLAVMSGVVVVTAAGNSGPNSYTISAPSTSPLVISVGAGTAGGRWTPQLGDNIASFSSRGPISQTMHLKPDIIAPGVGIATAALGGGYVLMDGTSFASPIVAGISALMRQQFPTFTPNEIKATLMNTARPLATSSANQVFTVGAGFVQPHVALVADTVVSVTHNVPVDVNPSAPFLPRQMASLSFGNFQGTTSTAQVVSIRNIRQTSRTFTVSASFTRNPGVVGSFFFTNSSITVAPGGTAQFDASLFTGYNAPLGFYEGYILIHEGATLVARLPFAARLTATVEPSNDLIGQFVARLYTRVLGRNYDQTGLQYWTNVLRTGGTGANVAHGFFFSREFIDRNVSNDEFVNTLYMAFLDRAADVDGFAYWTNQLNAGLPREDVFAGFVNSVEFGQLCREAGIVRGTFTPPAGGLIRVFVTRLYRTTLQREPDTVGLNSWTNQLVSGRSTGAQVAYGFVFSNEMNNRNLTNAQFITILYNSLLGREVDTYGFNYWMGQLSNGMSRRNVFIGFVMSAEFDQICRAHGIVRGTIS